MLLARAINASAWACVAATSRRHWESVATKYCRIRQTGGMPDLLGQGQRLLTPLLGLVRIA